MAVQSNERISRIEANLDRVTALLAQSAERQSVFEHQFGANLDRVNLFLVQTAERQSISEHQIDKILAAQAVDGEHIRALVRIVEDLEEGEA